MNSKHTLKLDTIQNVVFSDSHQFRVMIGGRRLGKSHLATVELIYTALKTPNTKCLYVASTLGQAKRVIWNQLLQFAKPYIHRANHSDLTITLLNGSIIQCVGVAIENALRGIGQDFMVLDEFASWDTDPKAAWEGVLMPMLLLGRGGRGGRALFISSPKGYNFAYDLFTLGQADDPHWKSWRFRTEDCPRVSQDFLNVIRRTTDPRMFRQEYEASFEAAAGIVYDTFDVRKHVVQVADNGSQVWAGIDFNVNPISCAIVQNTAPGIFTVIDEIEVWGSTTQEMADRILSKYGGRVVGCPDPTGRFQRSVGTTDVDILEKAGIPCPAWTPIAINDRVNNTQTNLMNAAGEIHLYINSHCTKLIKCLSSLEWGTNSLPDHKSDYAHMTDALGYALWVCNNLFVGATNVTKMRLH